MSTSCQITKTPAVTTAVLLAAGTGTRLQPLTLNAPKCLTEIGGTPLLERLVSQLRAHGINRLIVIIGYLGDHIQEFLQQYASDMKIDYVINPIYRTTNNIYSLWLARQQISESFLLLESDLIFESWMLEDMLQPNKMAISEMLPWMNGTTVELGEKPSSEKRVTAVRMGGKNCDNVPQYKTVNIYSLSLESWGTIDKKLGQYISDDRVGEYYEAVFAEMVADGSLSFDAVFFDEHQWYEIDTRADLREAEKLFALRRAIKHPSKTTKPASTVA